MGKKAPEAPDPFETADAQLGLNVDTATQTKDLNATDVYNPFGSSTWQRDDDGKLVSQTTSLNEEAQKAFDFNQAMGTNLAGAANDLSKFIPNDQMDMSGLPQGGGAVNVQNTDNIAQAQFDRFMSLNQPNFAKQRNANNVMLADRGIPLGAEISDLERNRVNTNINEATGRAGWDALLSAGNEQSRQFGLDLGTEQRKDSVRNNALSDMLLERAQPLNEIQAIMGNSPQMQLPQGSNSGLANIGAPDLQGGINQKYKYDLDAHNQSQQDFWGGVMGIGKAAMGFPW